MPTPLSTEAVAAKELILDSFRILPCAADNDWSVAVEVRLLTTGRQVLLSGTVTDFVLPSLPLSVIVCPSMDTSYVVLVLVSILSRSCNKVLVPVPNHIVPVSNATYNVPSITLLLAVRALMLGSLSRINFTLAKTPYPFYIKELPTKPNEKCGQLQILYSMRITGFPK